MSDLSELFDRDPLSLTKDDRAAIVRAYREAQAKFNLGMMSAGATKKVTAKGPKIQSLDDILGDM
jgi:hypothetical protein